MKKLLCVVVIAFLGAGHGFSQEATTGQSESASKSFRFGLKIAPNILWYAPDNEKKYENPGSVVKFSWGLMAEIRLSETASIATGLELTGAGGKLSFQDSTYYLLNADEEFVAFSNSTTDTLSSQYLLKERQYNVSYVTLPFLVKMKTKEIGYMTYFGQFGLNIGVKTKAKFDDTVSPIGTSGANSLSNEDLDGDDDMQLLNLALNVGAGFEYNMSGSTSLVFGVNYNHGFSNTLKKNSKYLAEHDGTSYNSIKQKATMRGITITAGILF